MNSSAAQCTSVNNSAAHANRHHDVVSSGVCSLMQLATHQNRACNMHAHKDGVCSLHWYRNRQVDWFLPCIECQRCCHSLPWHMIWATEVCSPSTFLQSMICHHAFEMPPCCHAHKEACDGQGVWVMGSWMCLVAEQWQNNVCLELSEMQGQKQMQLSHMYLPWIQHV